MKQQYIRRHFKNSGFTMIELMVVLVIVSTLIGLVGSLTIDRFDKTRARSEFISLQKTLSALSYNAFATSKQHTVKFHGKSLSIYNEQELIGEVIFEYLFFQPQVLVINEHGFPQLALINVMENNTEREIRLSDIVK